MVGKFELELRVDEDEVRLDLFLRVGTSQVKLLSASLTLSESEQIISLWTVVSFRGLGVGRGGDG